MTKKYVVDLSNYEIIKKLNHGAYGIVYKVKEKMYEENFAAKVINLAKTTKLMINREIGILSRIKHPTIVRFFGYSLTDFDGFDNVTLILQLSTKGSLADLIKKARTSPDDVDFNPTIRQKILIGIARGMMYLHQNNIIHRDLKPGNVLLDDDYEPLITDFGTSKIIACQPDDQTQTIGTSIYMAPEVIESGNYNGKADVFSFGILMYEVVTTLAPYAELFATKISVYNFTEKILTDHECRPKFKGKIKKSIRELIEKCWAFDPAQRPSFEEIFNRLAFNMEDSVYDVFESDDKEGKYCLPGADKEEILSYIYKVNLETGNENDEEIDRMKKKITKLEKENQKMFNRIKKLENENKAMKKQMEDLTSSNPPKKTLISPSLSVPSTSSGARIVKRGSMVDISCDKDDEFDGILKYLKTNSKDFTTEIEITLSSLARNRRFSPLDMANFKDYNFELATKDEEHSWIRINFLKHKVIPKGYTIRSTNAGENGSHPKSWVIEGSTDSIDWSILDIQEDCTYLNGRSLAHNFPIDNSSNDKYKSLRMRQTDCNCFGHNILCINSIEFYGTIV